VVEAFRAALRTLRQHLLRSLLTTLGIIIGVMAVIAVVSLIQGLSESVETQFQGIGANGLFVYPHVTEREYLEGEKPSLTRRDLLTIEHDIPHLRSITPELHLGDATARSGAFTTLVPLTGTTPSYARTRNVDPIVGRFLVPSDIRERRRVVVVGTSVVRDLHLGLSPLGRYITMDGEWFKIVGVLKPRGRLFGENLDNLALIPYTVAASIAGPRARNFLVIALDVARPSELAQTAARIRFLLRRNHHLRADQHDNFRVRSAAQIAHKVNKILDAFTFILAGIVAISLLVGGIGIMNIMLVSVTERTREIGILKSLGATRRDILLQFLIEAVVVSLLGGIVGVVLGFLVGEAARGLIPGFTHAYVPLWAVLLALGFSTVVGVVFGIAPAAKAAALDPLEALRYE
jgi:putative ABC transport system permease protein